MKIKILNLIIILFLLNTTFASAQVDGINLNLNVAGSCNHDNICEATTEDFFSCPSDCTPIIVPPSNPTGGVSGSLVMDNVFNNLSVEVSYTTATIKWKSIIPTMSNIKWGIGPDYKDGVLRNINFILDHKVEITGLSEGTLYYFNIEAVNLLGKTNSLENQVFRTLSTLDTTPPSNPTNVKADSDISGITISWDNPTENDFDYVRVMKSDERYYGSPSLGYLVYEGKGSYFVDAKVVDGHKYFYSLFSRDRAGNYSSGSLISIIHNPKGKDNWGTNLQPVEKLTPTSAVFVVTQDSFSYNFNTDNRIKLSGDKNINIKTNYSLELKDDDMWVEIRDSDKKIIGQYFFSRAKDKYGFMNVDIPSFEKGGDYNISIYMYYNDVTKLISKGGFQITKASIEASNLLLWYIFWIILLLLLIVILIILFRIFYHKIQRKFDSRHKKVIK